MNRLLDIITEPDNTITTMKPSRFSQGDHIFYRDEDGATNPHTVQRTNYRGIVRGWWVLLDDGRWVKSANCQLQSDWAKENDQ